jgi:L-rhamnose mutarotase
MINGVRFKINETKDGEKKMERVVFVQFIKEGCQEAYEKAHSPENLWPSIIAECQAAGMHNYTGYIGGKDGRMVVGYFEVESHQKMIDYLAKSDVNTEWSKIVNPLMETGGDVSNGSMEFMRPIWRIE